MGAGGGFRAFAWFDDLPARQGSRHAAVPGDVRRRELRARKNRLWWGRCGCRESPGCWEYWLRDARGFRSREASGCRFQEAPGFRSREAPAAGAVVQQPGEILELVRVRPAQHRLARSPLLARHHLAHPRTDKAEEGVFVGGRGGASPLPTPLTKNANREKFLEKLFLGIDNRPAFVYI